MARANSTSIEQSGAFVETFDIASTGDGPLAGLRFAVKDIIDIAGLKTGCGNPTWRDTHPPARSHADCVEQLLFAGARCVGKTVSDEVAFSLIGENHFYGTPLNPKAPDRVPGGSSSGSASVVACGLADFALGTDTGGSVRVPASNCGIWGLRPSHGFISVAGVMPFAPTFDTVGVHASSAEILKRASRVLLGASLDSQGVDRARPAAIYLLRDAFELALLEVRTAYAPAVDRLRILFGDTVREISLGEIVETSAGANFDIWFDTYCVIQWSEIENSLGPWIADAKPRFGPVTTKSLELVANLDRRRVPPAIVERERLYQYLRAFFGPRDLLCIPTAPAPAPIKGSLGANPRTGDYYKRALSLTSIAGIGRLPQVSMPLSTVESDAGAAPVGLSLLSSCGEDLFLLDVVEAIANAFEVE